jgi:predicted CopG family antitoxin
VLLYVYYTYTPELEPRMQKKLTISIDKSVYEGLYNVVGARRISQFIEDLVRPHVVSPDLEAAYAEMAADEEREAEAREWVENLLPDISDEAR